MFSREWVVVVGGWGGGAASLWCNRLSVHHRSSQPLAHTLGGFRGEVEHTWRYQLPSALSCHITNSCNKPDFATPLQPVSTTTACAQKNIFATTSMIPTLVRVCFCGRAIFNVAGTCLVGAGGHQGNDLLATVSKLHKTHPILLV